MLNNLKQTKVYKILHSVFKNSFFYQIRKRFNNQIASFLYWNASKALFVIWVTWTTWKTTTVNLIHKLLNESVAKTLIISGDTIKIWDQEIKWKKLINLTTYDVQSTLASAVAGWCKMAVIETNWTWLERLIFEAVEFNMWVLTNMTQDHLVEDKFFHEYIKNKEKLFRYILRNNKVNKFAILSKDDKIWRKRFDEMAFDKKISFSITNSSMLKAEEIIETGWWTKFKFSYLWKSYSMSTWLLWAFNVYNLLATIWVWAQIWLNMENIIKSLEWFQPWDSKFQNFENNWIFYFIDSSSSPDSLDKVLKFLAHIKNKWRLITVLWAPWWILLNKRANIWATAQRYSDILVVTDDDAWKEDRLKIISQLTEKITMKEWENLFVIPERSLAIKFAVKIAQKWDIVIFAGKWKQITQITNFDKKPRNEKEEILKAINNLIV